MAIYNIYKIGEKVIITTTTHMFMPKSNVVLTGKKDDIIKLLHSENMVTVRLLCNNKDTKFKHNQLKNKKVLGILNYLELK